MKKIILGSIMTTGSPFIILFGAWVLSFLKVNENAFMFASIMGGISIVVNFIFGILLIIRGYQDQKTFEGWGA